MSNAYTAQNTAWREKLAARVKGLSDAEMAMPAGGPGWTVGGLLGHLAFYDLRAAGLLVKWKKDGISPSPNDVDIVNDASRSLFNAVGPREMKRLVVEAAQAVDAAIEGLAPDFIARIETEGKAIKLSRAAHREHHLAQIEKAL